MKKKYPIKVKWADDCIPCECCEEPWCEEHQEHYSDCPCVGPDQTDEYDYDSRHEYARKKLAVDDRGGRW
jgi:hypothetical protein